MSNMVQRHWFWDPVTVRSTLSLAVQLKYDGDTHTYTHVDTQTAMGRADGGMLQLAYSSLMEEVVYSAVYW